MKLHAGSHKSISVLLIPAILIFTNCGVAYRKIDGSSGDISMGMESVYLHVGD